MHEHLHINFLRYLTNSNSVVCLRISIWEGCLHKITYSVLCWQFKGLSGVVLTIVNFHLAHQISRHSSVVSFQ